jgi:hydrogenase-1 operon protein HyaF
LGAEPISAFERVQLLKLLGKGELNISLSSLGESKIYETAYSGVWVVEHKNEQGQITSQFIEVTHVPDIVLSQMDDESASYESIQALIDNI